MSENPVLVAVEGASSGGIIPDPDIMFDLPAANHESSISRGDERDPHEPTFFTDRVTDVRMPAPRATSPLRPRPSFPSGSQDSPEFEQGRATKSPVYDAHQRREELRREAARRAQDAKIREISRHMAAGHSGDGDDLPGDVAPIQPAKKSTPTLQAGFQNGPDFEFEPAIRLHSRTAKPPAQSPGCVRHPAPVNDTVQQGTLAEQRTEPLPTGDVRALMGRGYPETPVAPREDRTGPRGRDTREPFVHVDGAVRSSTTDRRDKQSSPQLQSAERFDPIDRVERIATLARCCATCRDFRQVGTDGRGWCSNPYAFGERRMVQSDQLACRSSLGMWWMPNDDVWLERADTSHHGRPTPLLDASLKVQRSGESGRDSHA